LDDESLCENDFCAFENHCTLGLGNWNSLAS
jgi:hypothetical protein